MANEFQKLSGDYQRTGREAFGSMVRSAANFRKSLQGMSLEMADFSKRSVNQAIEAQAELTKKAFSAYISEFSKFATMGLYRPFFGDDDGVEEQKTGRRKRGATATRTNSTSRKARNKHAGSVRSGQRTAAQRASAHRKTGAAKRRSPKTKN
jgi:hypothetical protein